MLTLAVSLAPVKTIPLPTPTVAEDALADRLAFLADGGDPDDYHPEWAGDIYEPTPEESAEWDLVSERDASLRAYFERLDREHQEWEWEHEQRVEICEAKGWPLSLA